MLDMTSVKRLEGIVHGRLSPKALVLDDAAPSGTWICGLDHGGPEKRSTGKCIKTHS